MIARDDRDEGDGDRHDGRAGAEDHDVGLPTSRAADLDQVSDEGRWLIDRILTRGACVIGGTPKCAKSWLGLDMAVSVASNTPFLGRFAVQDNGPTLVFLAEDALPQVRARIAGICAHRRVDLAALDLHVITAPTVRLDNPDDLRRLDTTLARLRPRLLVLDPLVRMHRADENSSGEISAMLGDLRGLQRRYDLAVVLVHHMSKRSRPQLGQALRGSGDLHAWIDDGAYLTRSGDKLRLTLEHRVAPAREPMDLRLASDDDGARTHLEMVNGERAGDDVRAPRDDATPEPKLHDLVLRTLRDAQRPLSRADLRVSLRVGNNRLGAVLGDLETQGHILRSGNGVALAG